MSLLVLGIGNLLMGDEGVGLHVVKYIEENDLAPDVDCVDGGTGGFALLDYFRQYDHVVMVDATIDGKPSGTVTRITPRFSDDFPLTLTAHDIGLKDLLDALYLLDQSPVITLFTISLSDLGGLNLDLTPEIASAVPRAAKQVASFVHESSTAAASGGGLGT
ncbi:MAG: hydrogenase maturation protease [Rhodothermales bacterium]